MKHRLALARAAVWLPHSAGAAAMSCATSQRQSILLVTYSEAYLSGYSQFLGCKRPSRGASAHGPPAPAPPPGPLRSARRREFKRCAAAALPWQEAGGLLRLESPTRLGRWAPSLHVPGACQLLMQPPIGAAGRAQDDGSGGGGARSRWWLPRQAAAGAWRSRGSRHRRHGSGGAARRLCGRRGGGRGGPRQPGTAARVPHGPAPHFGGCAGQRVCRAALAGPPGGQP